MIHSNNNATLNVTIGEYIGKFLGMPNENDLTKTNL